MDSQTSSVAKRCRIQLCAMQIKECQNSPSDMTVDEWCIQKNITKTNYYYRLKCIRQAYLDSMESTPAVVELSVPEVNSTNGYTTESAVAVAIHVANGFIIELYENVAAQFMKNLIEAYAYN